MMYSRWCVQKLTGALFLVMKWRWCQIVSAQLAYSLFSPLFSRFPEKLLRLGHGATPQFATNSARVTADIYLRAYICTKIHNWKYPNTQLQMHKYEYTISTRVTAEIYLCACIALHCSEGHIFNEYWWDCRKYANTDTAQDICWWDTGMSQPPSKKVFQNFKNIFEPIWPDMDIQFQFQFG